MASFVMDFIPRAALTVSVWSLIIIVPLFLTTHDHYKAIFPANWYDAEATSYWKPWGTGVWPSPLGLSLGLLAVVVGQVFVLTYFVLWKQGRFGKLHPIQTVGAPAYDTTEAMGEHLSQPEGFVMLGGYLILTWMLGIMPASYYSLSGGISIKHVVMQLLIQDAIQTAMHYLEHLVADFYKISHKPHHRFLNPKLFDAFNGSVLDTLCMILIPLAITAQVVPANVWSYMTFGSLYANWLTLIHSEYSHPWDPLFRHLGMGTAGDHHVHHKKFIYNYGHLFMHWDRLFDTYHRPVGKEFNNDI